MKRNGGLQEFKSTFGMRFIYSWSWDENGSELKDETGSHSYAQNFVYGQRGTIPFIYVYIK